MRRNFTTLAMALGDCLGSLPSAVAFDYALGHSLWQWQLTIALARSSTSGEADTNKSMPFEQAQGAQQVILLRPLSLGVEKPT